jgi:hypothetical protein
MKGHMLKLCTVALSSALMFFMVGVSSCGGTGNPCVDRKINCDAPSSCDPFDGVCKCGGRGGVVCSEGSVCDPMTNTCLSKKCAAVDCTQRVGTSCDVNDGVCKCGGTGGVTCSASEVCNPNAKACVAAVNCNQVACPNNQVCEQSSGKCKCGTTECTLAQSCATTANGDRMCVNNNCSGVSCTGTNLCDAADGLCKCNGVLCQSGEACACPAGSAADAGCADSARTCRAGNACANVTCQAGQTCDPADGVCRCGGPGGPACAANQICNLGPPAQCQGGQQCQLADGGARVCAGGTSCDPEDGRCKCGGRGGLLCASANVDAGVAVSQICIQNPVQQVCRTPCDVRNPDCPMGTYCYFDSSATTPSSYCAAASDSKAEEAQCNTATACFSTSPNPRSGHCLGLALGTSGICHAYCDVSSGTAGCTQVPRAQNCIQIPAAPANYGYCNPTN